MTVGLLLLSRVGVETSLIVAALYMFVLGVGLGCVMQVLVLIVQNAVPYSELGVATSGVTFFRSIGGSFGTAIFGCDLLERARRQPGQASRHCAVAEGAVQLEHHAGRLGQASAGRSSWRCRGLRGVDPNRVRDRGADRRDRVPRVLADTPGRAPARSGRISRPPIGHPTGIRSGARTAWTRRTRVSEDAHTQRDKTRPLIPSRSAGPCTQLKMPRRQDLHLHRALA